ncbi:TadE/TadG family type IV pilus assembly protein [Nocardioides sp. R-C-SC26]|uniref:TadE/TadG family type IV pilus assembly protein n=1 Tax=Nocardioides sp. R-C-SC26 TaxID=2870414 RepID=UPI001E32B602|nr:TadE family protein [Nocardioides sp. R-C-SC26]
MSARLYVSTSRRRESDRGAAAVEFALVMIPFILIVMGIISYGLLLSLRQSLSQAAAEGARAAAVTMTTSSKQQAGYDAVTEALSSAGIRCASGNLTRDGKAAGTCAVSAPGPCTPTPADATVRCVTVRLVYDYKNAPAGPQFPGLGILMPDTVTYEAQARVS